MHIKTTIDKILPIVCCFIITIFSSCSTKNDAELLDCCDTTIKDKVIAHRGFWAGDVNRQNSLMAIREASSLGIRGCEIDIWETKDRELVLSHDPIFHNIDISAHTLEEINNDLSLFRIQIPTLKDALEEIKKSKINLVVETKRCFRRKN